MSQLVTSPSLLGLGVDLLKIIVGHFPVFSIDPLLLKSTCKYLRNVVVQVYGHDHRYVAIQTDCYHDLELIWRYLPPIQSMDQIHTLIGTSLRHGYMDNYNWLNTSYPTLTPYSIPKLLAKHGHFELFKSLYHQTYKNQKNETESADVAPSSPNFLVTTDSCDDSLPKELSASSQQLSSYLKLAQYWCPSKLRAAIQSRNHEIIDGLYDKHLTLPFLLQAIQCNTGLLFIQEIYTRYDRSIREPLNQQMFIAAAENKDMETMEWLYNLNCPLPELNKIVCPSVEGLEWLLSYLHGEKKFGLSHATCAIRHNSLSTLQWLYDTQHIELNEMIVIAALESKYTECLAWIWSLLQDINPTLLTRINWYSKISLNLHNYTWLRQHGCCIEHYIKNSTLDTFSIIETDGKQEMSVWSYVAKLAPSRETFILMQHLSQYVSWSKEGLEYGHAISTGRLDHVMWLYEHQCPLSSAIWILALKNEQLNIIQWLDTHYDFTLIFDHLLMTLFENRIYNLIWCLMKVDGNVKSKLPPTQDFLRPFCNTMDDILSNMNSQVYSSPIDPRQSHWQSLWKKVYTMIVPMKMDTLKYS